MKCQTGFPSYLAFLQQIQRLCNLYINIEFSFFFPKGNLRNYFKIKTASHATRQPVFSWSISFKSDIPFALPLVNKSLTLIWKTTYPLLAVWHFLQVIESISSIRWLWPLTKKACHYRSFYKRWQYLEIQQGWWIRSRGAGEEGAREEGSRHLKSTPDREPPAHSVIPYPPQSGPAAFSQTVPPPQHPSPLSHTALTLQRSRHRVQLRDGPGWQRGRARLGCGRGVSVRHSGAGRWVRGVGAERGREIKSLPKRDEEQRGGGGESPFPKMSPPAPATPCPREGK